MAEIKNIIAPGTGEGGATAYALIRQRATGDMLNDADGDFSTAPADPYVAMTEHPIMKQVFTLAESRTAWADGIYDIAAYTELTSGTPFPSSDTLFAAGEVYLKSDFMVSLDTSVGSIYNQVSSFDQYKADISVLTSGISAGTAVNPFATVNADDPIVVYKQTHYNATFYPGQAFSSFATVPVWLTISERKRGDVLWTVQGTVTNATSMSCVFSSHPVSHTNQQISDYYLYEVQFRAANGSTIANAVEGNAQIKATLKVS